jgi:RimJ/RimL family protein N-acetyltransferase
MIKLEYFTKEDFDQLKNWITDDHLLTNWAGSLFTFPLTEEKLDWYISDVNDFENSDAFIYKAIDDSNGSVVGHISLGGISKKNNAGRISRVLVGNTAERGKGICTGMIKEVCRIGFEEMKLHRISLGVYDFNIAAIKCYEKCGFVKEGVFRDILKYDDKYWSLVEMSMLDHEWFEMKDKTINC